MAAISICITLDVIYNGLFVSTGYVLLDGSWRALIGAWGSDGDVFSEIDRSTTPITSQIPDVIFSYNNELFTLCSVYFSVHF